MSERLALDTSLWQNPKQATEDTTALFIEQGNSPISRRINYTELSLDEEGFLYHPAYGRLKNGIKVETKTDALEKEAFEKIENWSRNNQSGQTIWISPPYPEQEESRFIVYELKQDRNRKIVKLHAFPEKYNLLECLSIARKITTFSEDKIPVLDDEDALRKTPISFNPTPFYPSWINFLEEIMPSEIWKEIRAENHIRRKQELSKVVTQEIEKLHPQITKAQSQTEHLLLGAKLERNLSHQGYTIQPRGSCGISNTYALMTLNGTGTIIKTGFPRYPAFDLIYQTIPNYETSFPCPKCNKPIPSNRGITKCPHCGITKEEFGGSKCD